MKRVMSIIIMLILVVLSLSINASATGLIEEVQLDENQTIEYFSDGSYIITTLSEEIGPVMQYQIMALAAAQTKSGSRSSGFYNSSNVLQWTVTVNGTFSYDGSSATCTSSSVSYIIYNSAWKVTSAVASKSGNKAIGDFTVKRYTLLIPVQTETVRLTLTCSANGTLS